MKTKINVLKLSVGIIISLSFFISFGQQDFIEKTETFFPNATQLENEEISWGYLLVPENWEEPKDSIKVAFTILKNRSKIQNAGAVAFIQGGPGASGVGSLGTWLNHPFRTNHDIILFDVRGTGYSSPRLCPDLGQKFFEILSKNQTKIADEKEKIEAASQCRQQLIKNGVDISQYHSKAVAKDLHFLKEQLGYTSWNIYGASYGTYMAQVYASAYPDDIMSLILDSTVADISTYYEQNTSNYMLSLHKVIEACQKDPDCHGEFPDIQKTYEEVIVALEKNPITVEVDKGLIPSGEFTFNAEDFKISIQQALYNKQLVEVTPMLIDQFHKRNKKVLGNLVAAFASLLNMDYGVYFCVSCSETLPNNEIADFYENAKQFKALDTGLAFYESDFKVCDMWNENRPDSLSLHYDLKNLKKHQYPVLIYSGEFDPITPVKNGQKVADKFSNSQAIIGYTYGHVPGLTKIGEEVAVSFINNPSQRIDPQFFKKANKLNMADHIELNHGVSNMGHSIGQLNLVFIIPFGIALCVMFFCSLLFVINFFRREYNTFSDKSVRILAILTSAIGLFCIVGLTLALLEVSNQNFYILAFGLPDEFGYLITMALMFLALLLLTLLFYVLRIKKIKNRSIIFSLLFSNILAATYLLYWGVVSVI